MGKHITVSIVALLKLFVSHTSYVHVKGWSRKAHALSCTRCQFVFSVREKSFISVMEIVASILFYRNLKNRLGFVCDTLGLFVGLKFGQL